MDQHGAVLDIFAQVRRNAEAAKVFFERLLHGGKYKPTCLITDGPRSYGCHAAAWNEKGISSQINDITVAV